MQKNLKNNIWKRLLYMAGFSLLFYIMIQVLLVLATIQFGFNLLTGKSNTELSNLCSKISNYIHDIALFLIFKEHLLPYPFMPISSYDKKLNKKAANS